MKPEIVNETKVLGLIITSDLSWRKNTDSLVTKANKRLFIVRNLVKFPIPWAQIVNIYCQFVRVILEFNSNVWFSSITEEESEDIERVQKTVCKMILKDSYINYEKALDALNLQDLKSRRTKLAIKFGRGCLEIPQMKEFFITESSNEHFLRSEGLIYVQYARTHRLFKSSIPTLQRLLNEK